MVIQWHRGALSLVFLPVRAMLVAAGLVRSMGGSGAGFSLQAAGNINELRHRNRLRRILLQKLE